MSEERKLFNKCAKGIKNIENSILILEKEILEIEKKVEENTPRLILLFFTLGISFIIIGNDDLLFIPVIPIGGLIVFFFMDRMQRKREAQKVQTKISLELTNIHKLELVQERISEGRQREKARDYDSAINIWEEFELIDEAARVRKLKSEQGSVKVSQKVVQGDEVTEIKDSVLNRSNVGGSSSKMQELKDLTEMKEKGLIDDDEFKQMKKEILGK